eukprot:CAMPEP_0179201810 /NCGR_PEP_ID=MMETSP0796-20121207/100455_1 /TAXON_ID=73915 /ORGANISM="Pyrodinium bahamense, Strain pbaha01" /LENGTH=48 /DNA_ID= /DNA_START= /DNA_END= /DNA_ORIENTATION=
MDGLAVPPPCASLRARTLVIFKIALFAEAPAAASLDLAQLASLDPIAP